MRIYQVGGSLRDTLRGQVPNDLDYVVVGATIAQFLAVFPRAIGIGKAFPVFQVGPRQFAFARTERKVGAGYKGFEIHADPSVTLTDDLARRDFTCNAIAREVYISDLQPFGPLIDPFAGSLDIQHGMLRHVGPAFVEDPLRVYRLARFAARFGWSVYTSTLDLCRTLPVEELQTLSAERIYQEVLGALQPGFASSRFFWTLKQADGLRHWFSEVQNLVGVPAGFPHHHGEGDTFIHTMLALDQVREAPVAVKLGVLCHDFGKAATPRALWPRHHGHDATGVPIVRAFCARLRIPTALSRAAVLATAEHLRVHKFPEMRPGKQVDLIARADSTVLKAEGLATICCADSRGRIPPAGTDGPMAILRVVKACREERGQPIPGSLKGPERGLHVRWRKGLAITRALKGGETA